MNQFEALLDKDDVIEMLQAEVARKERLIEKLKRGNSKRMAMYAQMAALMADRDHWKAMAQEGSKSMARTLNEYRDRAIRAESTLARIQAGVTE